MGPTEKLPSMGRKANAEVLPSLVDLKDRKVADIGCGDGSLVRLMARHGAKVIGVECNQQVLERARAAKQVGDEFYYEGVGEDLPFDTDSLDLVVFFNSLHHVTVDKQDTALAEAARVLKLGGQVYISEPLAEGAHFDMMRPVHDETDVRANAYKTIKDAKRHDLIQQQEITYIHSANYADFSALRDRLTTINPHLETLFTAKKAEIQALFDKLGKTTANGVSFDQPMRVNLLQKE